MSSEAALAKKQEGIAKDKEKAKTLQQEEKGTQAKLKAAKSKFAQDEDALKAQEATNAEAIRTAAEKSSKVALGSSAASQALNNARGEMAEAQAREVSGKNVVTRLTTEVQADEDA